MNISDLSFNETGELADILVGGLSLVGDYRDIFPTGGPHPHPRPFPIHPPVDLHPPVVIHPQPTPRPHPRPWPRHPGLPYDVVYA